jgi:hypothetical protein
MPLFSLSFPSPMLLIIYGIFRVDLVADVLMLKFDN